MASRSPDEQKRIRRVLFWVGALALAVRPVYFGEHSRSVLRAYGYDEDAADALIRSGVVSEMTEMCEAAAE